MAVSPADGRVGGASTVWKACGRSTICGLAALGAPAANATPALMASVAVSVMAIEAVRNIGGLLWGGGGDAGEGMRGGGLCRRAVARSRVARGGDLRVPRAGDG